MTTRKTIPQLTAMKGKTPIVTVSTYTTPMARLFDTHADMLLVGDSLGMVLYGMESTLPVSLELMIRHGAAVVRGSQNACVIVDMPFGSYQASPGEAFTACAQVMAQTGCGGVKIEGGEEMRETIAFLTKRAVPVMAHIGLKPQHVHTLGGYRYQGRTPAERKQILADAKAVQEAGAFAVVIEATEESLAREITESLTIPTIGIGASPACDGQVLVADDLLGMNEQPARFVKTYASLNSDITAAAERFAADVRSRKFPAMEHCFLKKGD